MRLSPLLAIGSAVVLAAALVAMPAAGAAPTQGVAAQGVAAQTVTVDGSSGGKRFDGVGGISAGASSRLLYDYPPKQRSQLLDYLFKPDYGASLQLLKVEIGGDTNSTDGAEASHERSPGAIDCNRGYEWWLMEQAKQRNPNIKLYGLEWGAPSWFTGGFWSQDNIHYIQSWLACARSHHLSIDYIGGWNERGWDASWYEQLDKALAVSDPNVKIVADDGYQRWTVATAMKNDPAFANAVDIVGTHDPCGARSLYQRCPSTADAQSLDKPLWASETSSEAHDVAGGALARSLNRDYLDGGITAELFWSLISSWYSDLPIADTGLMLAYTPWSGNYDIGSSIWAIAQTSQFAQPGWRYLDTGSQYLDSGASVVSLRAPNAPDYSTVVETMDATGPQQVTFHVTGGLSTGTVHAWSTDLTSSRQADYLHHDADILPSGGSYTVTLQPGHVYTFTTTTGQHHGHAGQPAGSSADQLPLPFRQDFDALPADKLAPYFSDINGGFQTEPCQGGRTGMCYAQQVTAKPIAWNGTGSMDPTTIVGDPRWWGDYQVSTQALLDRADGVQLLGRVDGQQGVNVYGYHLQVDRSGAWRLYTQVVGQDDSTLASGTTRLDPAAWHELRLRFHGTDVRAYLDGDLLADVHDDSHDSGQAGLRVVGFAHAQFDDVAVTPTSPAPTVVPHSRMTATATSAHTEPYRGYTYPAYRAIDDRTDTMWHSEFSPKAPMPQAITLDLQSQQRIDGLAYRPRNDGGNGWITDYRVLTSRDGTTFTQVAQGSWPVGEATKFATWPTTWARYVRLVAVHGVGQLASAAELNVLTGPLPDTGADAYLPLVPQTAMTATATSYQSATYAPGNAIDGDPSTIWHQEYSPDRLPLPQSITLDLGRSYQVASLRYLPRQDSTDHGDITGYQIAVSSDGEGFTTVATGNWADSSAEKVVRLDGARTARYVRLTATSGVVGLASAAEINVGYR